MSYRKSVLSTLIVLVFLLSGISSPAILAQTEVPSAALDYLAAQQQPDGGLPGLSGTSDAGTTARAILAFKGLGVDPTTFISTDGQSLVDYLKTSLPAYTADDNGLLFSGSAGLALAALAPYESDLAGLPEAILAALQTDGSFSTEAARDFSSGAYTDLNQAFTILGLAASGTPIPAEAVDYLVSRQLEDGTWDSGFGPDPDTTAIVTVALLSSGQINSSHTAIQNALEYFRATQLDNGGWRPSWDTDPLNVDTTGWISLALITAGQDLADWSKDGVSPQDALLSQAKEDGSIGGSFVNAYSTVEALLGFAAAPLYPVTSAVPAATETEAVENKAVLVVTLQDGSSLLRCVTFTGESISGFDLLTASNLKLETANDPALGPGVCGIEGTGCPASNCFCDMPNYWSYWHMEDGAWAYSQVGAGSYEVQPGSVEGWSWGETVLPAEINFEQICSEGAAIFLPAVSGEQPAAEEAPTQPEPEAEAPAAEPEQHATPILNYVLYGAIIVVLAVALLLLIRKKPAA